MGFGLPHDQVVAQRVEHAALVAGDHAGRQPGRAHQHHERRREVLAEAASRVEQEFVDRIAAQLWRHQGVEERLLAEHRQGLLHDGAR